MTDFAAAVAEYQEALAVFDHPRLTEDPLARETVRHDWNAIREPAVLAEEAALERDLGCGTRSAGGGGERCGPDDGRSAALPAERFRPTHARIRDALRRLGTATTAQVAELAGTSHFTGACLLKMRARGEVKHDGGYPRRWTWVGPAPLAAADRELVEEARDLVASGLTLRKVCERFRAERRKLAGREVTPAWLMKATRTNEERPAMDAEPAPAGVSNAADEPQEVKKMGTPKTTDEQIIAAIGAGPTSTQAAAVLLDVCPEGLTPRLEKLRDEGRVSGGERGTGTGRPRLWSAGTGKARAAKASPAPTKKAKRAAAPASGTIASLLEREIDRQASLRAAAILRAHADAIEAEAGSAA